MHSEDIIKAYIRQAHERIDTDYKGTAEAMNIMAEETAYAITQLMGVAPTKAPLADIVVRALAAMRGSFAFGYAIGRVEGETKSRVVINPDTEFKV